MKKRLISAIMAMTAIASMTGISTNAIYRVCDINSDEYEKMLEGYVEFDDSGYCSDYYKKWYKNAICKTYYNEEKDDTTVILYPYDNFFYKIPNDENAEKAVEMAKQNSEWIFSSREIGDRYIVVSVYMPDDDKAKNYKDAADLAKKLKEVTNVIEFHFYNSMVNPHDEAIKCKQLTYYFDEHWNSHTDSETFISNIEELELDYTIDFGTDYAYIPVGTTGTSVTLIPNGEPTIEERFKLMKQIKDELGVNIVGGAVPASAGEELTVEGIEMANNVSGDTNNDGALTVADAAAILQYLGNAEEYPISAQGKFNADIEGDGITAADALSVQKMVLQSGNK